ncbi:MAG: 23S rRNA (guanosine(2251)-2'-O)-methyltransferase RlmB [Bacteroidota bacterium]
MSMKRAPDETVVAGRNPVRELIETSPERVEKVLIQRGANGRPIDQIQRLAHHAKLPVQHVPQAKLERLVPGVNHQGVAAVSAPVAYRDLDDMLQEIAADWDTVQARKPMLLLLDRIEDPHNFGALLRTAVAAGVDGVVVPQQHMAPLNAAAMKTSAGTAHHVPVARVGNLADAMLQLKERGYWLAGADGAGETSVWEMDWDRPIAVVLGSEGRGLRRRVQDTCDYLVSIPLRGPAESLNVSVAGGILLFAASRHR